MKIHRARGGKLEMLEASNAAPKADVKMVGAPVVIYSTPYRYVDRQVTPELIADSCKVPIIFSSLSFLNRLCFGGLDFKLSSIDGPEDDTKKDQIDQALRQIKQIDKNFAQIGRNKSCTTLDCIRITSLENWKFRQALFEKAITLQESNLYAPRLQHLPSQSFSKSPQSASSSMGRYSVDEILHGVIFDTQEGEPYYYQATDSMKDPTEIPAEQVLYIEDIGVPNNTSMLHSIISTVEFAKQIRNDHRLAVRRVGTPKEVAEVDGSVLAQMKAQGIEVTGGYQTLVDYCNNMVITQSSNQAEVALPGTRFKYPVIPVPLNPIEEEKFVEQIILNHFFGKGITEQLVQAISVSATPGKALLDTVISGHQEVASKPFAEEIWQKNFLDINGYDLKIEIELWSWAPTDKKAEQDKATALFQNGGALVNDYRALMGEKPYSKEELRQLFEEQNALKRGQLPAEAGSGEPQEPKKAATPPA